jgi:hypothetical protein
MLNFFESFVLVALDVERNTAALHLTSNATVVSRDTAFIRTPSDKPVARA